MALSFLLRHVVFGISLRYYLSTGGSPAHRDGAVFAPPSFACRASVARIGARLSLRTERSSTGRTRGGRPRREARLPLCAGPGPCHAAAVVCLAAAGAARRRNGRGGLLRLRADARRRLPGSVATA